MKKFLLLSIVLFLLRMNLLANYFSYLPYTITQPDGLKISCFVSGDEYFNWLHDKDGYTIIQAPDGYFYYGMVSKDIVVPTIYKVNSVNPDDLGIKKWAKISVKEYEQTRAFFDNSQNMVAPAPHTGTLNNLVVYIRFSDDTEFTSTRQTFDDKFNLTTGVSLKSYFNEVSYNQLTVNSTHYPACALTTNLSYQDTHARGYFEPYNETTNPIGYTGGNNGADRTAREHTLLRDAIAWINLNSPVPNTLNIDGDNDSYVDNVCFNVKGGNGAWNSLLWAHSWSLYSYNVYINSKRVYKFTFQPETQINTQTLCHEMFHAVGSPDLYHYSYDGLQPVESWDLMEQGFGHMGAYMKWKYSGQTWITNIPEITAPGTYTLNPLESSSNNCYKIVSPNSATEFFVVEYRKATGTYESNLHGSGLLIYRIDPEHTGNASGPPDEVYIYRPNGTTTANGSPSMANYSSATGRTAINNGTNPSGFLQDGSAGDLNISNITSAGTTISFNVSFSFVINPSGFTAATASLTQIDLEWVKNGSNENVLLAYSLTPDFGTPVEGTAYSAGGSIPGGGTVIYTGASTSFDHTGLLHSTNYYYKLWSVSSANSYSTGINQNAATLCGTFTTLPFIEGFSGTIIPACWTQVDHEGNGQVWQFGAITSPTPLPALTGNYAYLNSDAYGSGYSQDADLITPTLDLSSYSDVSLRFYHYFRSYGASYGNISYSIDGGDSWTEIAAFYSTTANPSNFNRVIPEVAGQPDVKFKWTYIGSWGYYWGIDNVEINGTMSAEPDLAVSALTFTPTSGAGGTVLGISTTIKNIGTANAGASSTIKYYFSGNSTWESSDTYIGMDGVGDLAPDATSLETINWTVPASLAVGSYYVIVRVDVNNTVTESDESNDFLSVATFDIMDKPDLAVSALTFTPAYGARGSVLNISTTVKNIGMANAGASSTIKYYFSSNSTWESTDPYIGVDGVGDLAPDATSPETISWTIPTTLALGDYYVIVRADVTNTVSESNESNNFVSATTFELVEKPDLVVSSLTFDPVSGVGGTVLNISTTIKNIGTASATAASTIRYYFSENTTWESTDPYIGVDGVGILAVGGTSPETISWTVPTSLAVGNYYVIVRVDVNSTVVELDESNDFASVATFGVIEKPDLVISALTFTPTSGARGTVLNISTIVKNIGTISSGAASTIKYYFSANTTWESTDTYIGVDGVGDLAADGTSPETISWTVPLSVAVGSYYVIVRADAGNTVSESNESNNFASSTTFDIIEQPDLVVSSLTFDPTIGARGTILNISTTVKNIGTISSGAASTIRYYFSENSTWESTDPYIGVDGVGDLAVGGTSPETISWTVPLSVAVGSYYVIVRADAGNTVSESDESNDFASATTFDIVEQPDLVISALTFTPTAGAVGSVLNISTTVKNIGTATSGAASTIRYYFSANSTWESTDQYIGVDGVGDLTVGGTSPETISWTIPASLALGTYYVIVRADVNNTVIESDESNDFASVTTFEVADKPDLVVSALTFTPTSGIGGTVLNISTTVKNIGTATSGAACTIRYYFSVNNTWQSTDPYIGVDGVGDLAVSATSPETISWAVPASLAAGSYYVIVRVDVTNTVSELNESNVFVSAGQFLITSEPSIGGGGDGKATLDLLVREDPQMKSYPNPFVDQTTIHYTLAEESKVLLRVYDMYGNLVFNLIDEKIETGSHQVDLEGRFIAKGMYYCVLTTPKGNYTLKMIKE